MSNNLKEFTADKAKVLIIDSNTELLNEEEKLYYARNKWLIAHPDGGQDGALLGLVGENITLED